MNRAYLMAVATVAALLLLCSAGMQTQADAEVDGMTFTLLSDGTAALSGYNGDATELVIPGTVEIDGVKRTVSTIPYGALNGNGTIRSITVPAGVTSIATTALALQSLLCIEVDEGNTVYSSEDGVLFDEDGTRLCQFPLGRTEAYTVPDGVETLGDMAFAESSLTEVTISDGVTSMGMSVFVYSDYLETVRIGTGLSSIGNWCFNNCPSLSSFEVDDGNPYLDSCDGVLYTEGIDTLLRFPQARGGSFEIPNGVTSLGLYSFAYNTSLQSVTIPSSVTSVGVCAFFYCSGLVEVVIEGDVPSAGEMAFYLSSGEDVTCMVYGPVGCLDRYGGSGTTLNYYDADTGEAAIDGISYSVSDDGATVTWIEEGVSELAIPSSIALLGVDVPVTAIDIEPSSEYDMTLSVLTIPATVTAVEPGSLWTFHALTEVVLEDGNGSLSVIDGVLFDEGGTRLLAYPSSKADAGYVVPDGVATIADHAFAGSLHLQALDLTGVTTVGTGAVSSCIELVSVDLGGTVVTVGDEAFAYDPMLYYVTGTEAVEQVGDMAFCLALLGEISLPAAVSIGDMAFYWCSMMTSVHLGPEVAYIGDMAFYGCKFLVSIHLDCPGAEIGDMAFLLTEEFLAYAVVYVPGMGWCGVLDDYTDASTVSITYVVEDGDTSLSYAPVDGGVEVYAYDGDATAMTVPSEFESDGEVYAVVAIADFAFSGNASLESVTIPGSVVTVGTAAFEGCTSLTSLTLEEGISEIGGMAFSGCTDLTEVILPSTLTEIGYWAFRDCPLETIVITSENLTIDRQAFGLSSGELSITVYSATSGIIDSVLTDGTSATYLDSPNTPVASRPSGVYGGTLTVSFGSSLGAEIHYTRDGTVPTLDDPVLDGALRISSLAWITVAAYVEGLGWSDAATFWYIVVGQPATPDPGPGTDTITISVVQVEGATITVTGADGVAHTGEFDAKEGETLTVTVTLEEGYALASGDLSYTVAAAEGLVITADVEAEVPSVDPGDDGDSGGSWIAIAAIIAVVIVIIAATVLVHGRGR